MQHRTVLEYQRYRYLKIALLIVFVSCVAYVAQTAPVGRYGGTVVGYALGILGALLILWLMWFGVRKRQYKASGASVQAWLSAHIYLGATLVIVGTLHAGFQVGWNVHTLAYLLMLVVIGSGFFGIYAYLRFPSMQTDNLGEDTLEQLQLKIADIDRELGKLSLDMPKDLLDVVSASIRKTKIGGGVFNQLCTEHKRCPTRIALIKIEAVNKSQTLKGEQLQIVLKLYDAMLRKSKLVARARRDIRLKAVIQVWLYFHVPLSSALLAALVAHIIAVFFYW